MKADLYEKITNQIVAELEKGVRPWCKPWNVEQTAERITRPLRANGIPYSGINVLMLWSAAIERGYAAPIWMTYRQAAELKANVRKGEHGSLVVYADRIIRTETDATGEESERAIPFLKGYTVFLSADLDLTPEVRADHASYIASWIKVLNNDRRAIFTVASHAQRAANAGEAACLAKQ
ncbi:hypothetical protein AOQ73_26750 [Bradyrhizobium pachyrhizi]|uniref:ArdC-like ssDNA-binding domain-containing protein n=1 Tax=Bradyrhizobium pachyrhizi TaxID=280333 RepID=UPI00070491E7|nr:ArdC-like ssDNA-binding domain-containing protein [Bradyrhizobium pachyrhizi]KRP89224.1 hypothetical protein AOQ73_26750 [Bradyrhizobium pachyrhizi]